MNRAPKRRWSRFSLRTLFVVAAVLVGCSGDPPPPLSKPFSALIRQEVDTEDGDIRWETIELSEPKKLEKLESFFPNYRQRPIGHTPGAWMVGYVVYFNFPQGESVRVQVSKNENAASWTMGEGDFDTQGDFEAFIKSLETGQ